jgi:hypothetical protein
MNEMQMAVLDQPTVFGYDAYFQTGYSRNWINTSQVGLRNSFTDKLVTGRTLVSGITPLITIKIDMLAMVDLTNVNHNATIPVPVNYTPTDAAKVVELVTTNLLATPLTANQMTFLTDTIMLSLQPRTSWTSQWNAYKATPNTTNTNTVKTKLENLMKYLLRMAEYSIG